MGHFGCFGSWLSWRRCYERSCPHPRAHVCKFVGYPRGSLSRKPDPNACKSSALGGSMVFWSRGAWSCACTLRVLTELLRHPVSSGSLTSAKYGCKMGSRCRLYSYFWSPRLWNTCFISHVYFLFWEMPFQSNSAKFLFFLNRNPLSILLTNPLSVKCSTNISSHGLSFHYFKLLA